MGCAHFAVQHIGTRGIDELHAALGQAFCINQCVISRSDNVDNRVAHGNNIKRGSGHRFFPKG